MAYISNKDKMLEAVLIDEKLMKFGKYTQQDIKPIYEAMHSDNVVIAAVARIIVRQNEGANSNEIYNEISNYLKSNL